MRRLPARGILTAFLVCAATVALAAQQAAVRRHAVTLDDIMGMKSVVSGPGAPAISPDGRPVLYVVRAWTEVPGSDKKMEARSHVWRVSADGGQAEPFTYSDASETAPEWSPDGRYIAFLSTRNGAEEKSNDRPHAQIWVMRADGGEAWQVTHAKDAVAAYAWGPDSKTLAFTARQPLTDKQEEARKRGDDPEPFEGDFQPIRLWTVNLDSKQATELSGADAFSVNGEPAWAPDGRHIAIAGRPTTMTRDDRTDIYIVDIASKTAGKITANEGPDSAPAWSPDGRTIAFLETPNAAPANGDGLPPQSLVNTHLMLYDVAARTLKDASAGFDASPGAPVWTADSQRLLFTAGRRAYEEVFAYDLTGGTYHQLTTDRVVSLGSLSRTGSRAAFTMQSATMPRDVYVADLTFAAPKKLTTINPQTAGFALGESDVITWKSTDGQPIEGVLQKPVGFQPGHTYPLLVVAHGGPTGAYENTFRVGDFDGGQLWAGEGWLVLYPNPRGSTNYGEHFMRENIGDWGGGDYRDIQGGVDALVARGLADPARMAFMGWSYGGYMTCWTVSQTTRFKAAMMGAGLADLVSMYGTTDIPNYLETFFHGTPDGSRIPLYEQRSGLTFVDKVTTPLLILQGGSDVRVPTSQSMEFYRALKDRGKTVQLVYYPREGHGFVEYYHLRDRIERLHAWITKYTLGSTGKTSAQ